MVIRTSYREIVKAVNAVGAKLVPLTQMRCAVCSFGIFLDHFKWSVTLIARVALVEGAGSATMAAGGGGALATGRRWDLGGCLIYASTGWGVGAIEVWERFGALGKTVFAGDGGLGRSGVPT